MPATTISPAQIRKIKTLAGKVFGADDEDYREMLRGLTGGQADSCKDLKGAQIDLVIGHLQRCLGQGQGSGARGQGPGGKEYRRDAGATRRPPHRGAGAPKGHRVAARRDPGALVAGEPGGAGVRAGVAPGPLGPGQVALPAFPGGRVLPG